MSIDDKSKVDVGKAINSKNTLRGYVLTMAPLRFPDHDFKIGKLKFIPSGYFVLDVCGSCFMKSILPSVGISRGKTIYGESFNG